MPPDSLFDLPGFEITSTSSTPGLLTIAARALSPTSFCPTCGTSSERIHSYYTRTPRDLPVATSAVRLVLQVRRFRCLQPVCPRKTFAERIPALVPTAAQRTTRMTQSLARVGVALGGEAGARLSRHLALPTSPDTLLRIVRSLEDPFVVAPRVLGVDDWAMRRGQRYGTILVDLERRRPIDLLPDRTAETFAAWLEAHPGSALISRDRSGEYARGALLGAPEARHILDRWHLVHNLRENIERLLSRVRRRLGLLPAPPTVSEAAVSVFERETRRSTTEQAARQERRADRLHRYDTIHALAAQGYSTRHIARELKLSRSTVIHDLRHAEFPERARSRRPSKLDPYAAYLQERWDAGCHNGAQLWREIQERGFSGTRRLVSNWVVLRRERLLGQHSGRGRRAVLPEQLSGASQSQRATVSAPELPSPAQLVWLLLKDGGALTIAEQLILTRLQQDSEVETAYQLAQRFCQLIRARKPERFEQWLTDAKESRVPELRSFATTLARERDGVLAALELPYSNGPVEGQITKLKLLKRQGYGRAKLDLLRKRLLHAAE